MTKRRFEKRKLIFRAVALELVLCMSVVAISLGIGARAVYNVDSAIKYSQYKASHEIPEKMFFIGSYLIHKDAITSASYSKAIDSQSESNQFNIYYKSEIGDGGSAWYNISDATGLSSITTGGQIVDESEMKNLYVTYVVNADGSVINAKTGAAGSIFDDPDPYDFKNLPEFATLKAIYEAQYSDKSEGVDKYYYLAMKEFWETEVRDSETDELDTQIKNLNAAYSTMKAKGADTEADLIMDLMTQLDNKRRSIVYYKLVLDESMVQSTGPSLEDIRSQYEHTDEEIENMSEEERQEVLNNREELEADADKDADNFKGNNPTSILQSKLTGTGYEAWTDNEKSHTLTEVFDYLSEKLGEDNVDINKWNSQVKEVNSNSKYVDSTLDKQEFKVNSSVIDALNNAISDCKTSYTKYTTNILEDDATVLGHAMYTQKSAIVNIAKSSSTGMDSNLRNLALLNCIRDNTIKDGAAELALLDSELLPEAYSKYSGAVTGGIGTLYYTVKVQGGSTYAYETALSEQDAETGTKKTELESLMEAKVLRISTEDAFKYVNNCITENDGLKDQVVDDQYKDYANNQILSHKQWLQEEIKKLKARDESLLSEAEKLAKQKEDLLDKKQGALDDGDRNLAAKYGAEIAKIDDAIKNANENAGGAGTAADSVINDMKNEALSDIANGGDGKAGLDALAAMGATDAIADVAKEAGESDATKDAKEKSEANNAAGIGNDLNNTGSGAGTGTGSGTGTGTGSGAGTGAGSGIGNTKLTKGDIENALENFFGGSFGSLSDEDMVIAAVAANWYAQKGNQAAKELCANWINICAGRKNRYVFRTYEDITNDFASLRALGKCTDYRYVHEGSNLNGTLAGDKSSFSFSVGSNVITQAGGSTQTMSVEAQGFDNTIYIVESMVQSLFNMNVDNVVNSEYSALMTGNMTNRATEFLNVLEGSN